MASYAYDKTRLVINTTLAKYDKQRSVKVLEFTIDEVSPVSLDEEDDYGTYSVGGFRQVHS